MRTDGSNIALPASVYNPVHGSPATGIKTAGGAGGARTRDRRIMRSTASCTMRASCTDDAGYRTAGARRAGITRRLGPRTGPRPRPLSSFFRLLCVTSPRASRLRPQASPAVMGRRFYCGSWLSWRGVAWSDADRSVRRSGDGGTGRCAGFRRAVPALAPVPRGDGDLVHATRRPSPPFRQCHGGTLPGSLAVPLPCTCHRSDRVTAKLIAAIEERSVLSVSAAYGLGDSH
jgi:hypothetical protein